MVTLYYELLRKMFRQSCVVMFALVFCACIIQSSKFMYLVSDSHATVPQLFSAICLLAVDMSANVFPIAIAVAVCIVLYKFKHSNQMVALQGFGVPIKSLLKPVAIAAYISTIALYSITLYFSPISLQQFKKMKTQFINNISLPRHSGNLVNYSGISVFAQQYIGRLNFKGLTIIDTRTPNVFRTYFAESGNLINGVINLNHGVIKELDKNKRRISAVRFDSHSYNLNEMIKKLSLNLSLHEMSSNELLRNYSNIGCKAEFHNRLITPLLAILLALISFFCVCSKNTTSRNTSYGEIIYTVSALTAVEGTALWFSNMMGKNESLIIQYYVFMIAMIVVMLSLINLRLDR